MVDKIIHHIIGPGKNEFIERCLASWDILRKHDFEIKVWNDNLINAFILEQYPDFMQAILTARNHGEASDIARYLIIYHFGGTYIDWDIQLLDSNRFLKILDACEHGFLIIDPKNQTLASECFGANRGEKFLKYLAESINYIYKENKRDSLSTPQYSGPYRMGEAYKQFGNKRFLLFPVNEIFLYNYDEIRSLPERKIEHAMIHYWVHSWL